MFNKINSLVTRSAIKSRFTVALSIFFVAVVILRSPWITRALCKVIILLKIIIRKYFKFPKISNLISNLIYFIFNDFVYTTLPNTDNFVPFYEENDRSFH